MIDTYTVSSDQEWSQKRSQIMRQAWVLEWGQRGEGLEPSFRCGSEKKSIILENLTPDCPANLDSEVWFFGGFGLCQSATVIQKQQLSSDQLQVGRLLFTCKITSYGFECRKSRRVNLL